MLHNLVNTTTGQSRRGPLCQIFKGMPETKSCNLEAEATFSIYPVEGYARTVTKS